MNKLETIFWAVIGTAFALIALSIAAVIVYAAAHLIITGKHL